MNNEQRDQVGRTVWKNSIPRLDTRNRFSVFVVVREGEECFPAQGGRLFSLTKIHLLGDNLASRFVGWLRAPDRSAAH